MGVYDIVADFLYKLSKKALSMIGDLLTLRIRADGSSVFCKVLRKNGKLLYADSYYKDADGYVPTNYFCIYLFKNRLFFLYEDEIHFIKFFTSLKFILQEEYEYTKQLGVHTIMTAVIFGEEEESHTITGGNSNNSSLLKPSVNKYQLKTVYPYEVPDQLKVVLKQCLAWCNKDWFIARNINRRRGYLLYGEPGTGKSTFIEHVAFLTKRMVVYIDIASVSSKGLEDAITSSKDCIIVIEDIDCVFEKRKRIIEGKLDFSSLLNSLSRASNCLLFITTNNINAIDSALGSIEKNGVSSRPGRIDMSIEMPNKLTEQQRRNIATRILRVEQIEDMVKEGEKDTPAQFHNRCSVLAVKDIW
jgi:SpoVK/Ycf46/Vps4 family AAA+-type ATPase